MSDPSDFGLLLGKVLDRSSRPGRDPEYAALLARFETDPAFAHDFAAVCEGLGLDVVDVNIGRGLVVSAREDSPLAVTPGMLTSGWKVKGADDRMVYGVALAGIAAWCFPNQAALREGSAARFTAADVDGLIRAHGQALADGDAVLEDDLSDAWKAYEDRTDVDVTDSGTLRRWCTVKMVDEALDVLAEHGLVREDTTAPRTAHGLRSWRPTPDFRAHVAHAGGPLAWQALAHSGVPDRVVGADGEDAR